MRDRLDVVDAADRGSPLCVLGLGYVGLPLALSFVEAGFEVWGLERHPGVLRSLQAGQPHVYEPGLPAQLAKALGSGRFHPVHEMPTDVPFRTFVISVGTPLGADGSVSVAGVADAARQVAEVARPGALVVLRSTVPVGTSRDVVRPILDRTPDVEVAFCPERTLQGRAFEELRRIPQIVSGETEYARTRASRLFHAITPCVVEVSSVETAELIKLTANAYRDVTFGFANEIARLCDAVGVSASEVAQAGGVGYPRATMPRGGPVGGSCLTKDPAILISSYRSFGLEAPEVIAAARKANERVPADAAEIIAKTLPDLGPGGEPTLALLGIAFKGQPATGDTRGSQVIPLVERLREIHPRLNVRSHDPVAAAADHDALRSRRCESVEAAVAGAHIVVFGNDHPAYAAVDLPTVGRAMAAYGAVYDFWGLHRAHASRLRTGVEYFAPGENGVLARQTATTAKAGQAA